jgi:hypothetical protein
MANKADKRVVDMGGTDSTYNNVDPTFRGKVLVSGIECEVVGSRVFQVPGIKGGTLHFDIFTRDSNGNPFRGMVPACLCDIS